MRNKAYLTLVYIFVALACNNPATVNSPEKEDSIKPTPRTNEIKPGNNAELQQSGIPDFLDLVKNNTEKGRMWLQGVEKSDSTGPYVIEEFFSDTLNFRLLYYPRDGNKAAVDFNTVANGKKNNFKDFICFAFVYPMKNPNTMEDEHAENTKYPVTVKAYVRKETVWNFSSESKVNSLKELSQFEIRSIYANL